MVFIYKLGMRFQKIIIRKISQGFQIAYVFFFAFLMRPPKHYQKCNQATLTAQKCDVAYQREDFYKIHCSNIVINLFSIHHT